ncbi:hypothetical protein M0R45_014089 [Rubus argutus]|uniref:Uncharacterized protein n=1 Tax=Rubus argutus TaxID=59490 RepID=A0AAW1XMW2_RUBAR
MIIPALISRALVFTLKKPIVTSKGQELRYEGHSTVDFGGVCGTLVVKKSWRYAYFRFFEDIKEKAMLAHLQRSS